MWAGDEAPESNNNSNNILPGQEQQSEALLAKTDFESFAVEVPTLANKPASEASSSSNGYRIPASRLSGILKAADADLYKNGQCALPAEKAFSIQLGWRLFRLSGASIMSDAPSYFSAYFEEQVKQEEAGNGPVKTLYIDRDPDTFIEICRHLQGYNVVPRDEMQYVKLYADAQFYSLPRLISQIFESDIYASVGGCAFQIPRDTFNGPGNSSNFFTLGFANFLGTRDDAFPGLESRSLMRPPPIPPQTIPNRSPDIFTDLLNLARGYPVHIRDADHRASLLRDCKYYGFKGLMHKIFTCEISYNAERASTEIVMRLEDLHKSGVSFQSDPSPSEQSPLGGWVHYSRPFVDEARYEAIIEIGHQETKIDFRSMRAEFYGDTKARISVLFQTIADKMNLPSNLPLGLMMNAGGASAASASPANTPLSEDRVKIHIGPDAYIILDGQEYTPEHDSSIGSHTGSELLEDPNNASLPSRTPTPSLLPSASWPGNSTQSAQSLQQPPTKKRKRRGSLDEFGEWIVKKGQWRMRIQPRQDAYRSKDRLGEPSPQTQGGMEIVLWAVKLEAIGGQRGLNMCRGWLG